MKIRKKLPSVLKYGALLLTIILLLFPIYWMVICSLMPTHYLTVLPPHFVPVDITLDNYIQIAQTPKYVAYFRNSVIVAIGTVLTRDTPFPATGSGANSHCSARSCRFRCSPSW